MLKTGEQTGYTQLRQGGFLLWEQIPACAVRLICGVNFLWRPERSLPGADKWHGRSQERPGLIRSAIRKKSRGCYAGPACPGEKGVILCCDLSVNCDRICNLQVHKKPGRKTFVFFCIKGYTYGLNHWENIHGIYRNSAAAMQFFCFEDYIFRTKPMPGVHLVIIQETDCCENEKYP